MQLAPVSAFENLRMFFEAAPQGIDTCSTTGMKVRCRWSEQSAELLLSFLDLQSVSKTALCCMLSMSWAMGAAASSGVSFVQLGYSEMTVCDLGIVVALNDRSGDIGCKAAMYVPHLRADAASANTRKGNGRSVPLNSH